MLIESLIRLTTIDQECKERGIVISSEEFMKETREVIDAQLELLKKDMQFQTENPGPYNFGLGKWSIIVFPPVYTETSDWALIVYNEETQIKEQVFIFQTLYGLIENFAKAFKHIENASTNSQSGESQTEAGSVQADPAPDSVS
jgi:hypothetical protein